MQLDFFAPRETRPVEPITLLEHMSSDYGPRTGENARSADATVAFATDFTTAGERLTKRVAGNKYVAIPFGSDAEQAADALVAFMASKQAMSLNVAGNGIYTLKKSRVTQDQANQWVYDVLKRTAERTRITHIRSGGQTGIDVAGLVAGIAPGVPVTGLFPKGYRQRGEDQRDFNRTQTGLFVELKAYADNIQR